MQILGIDPGIRNTGWGIVGLADGRLSHVANGVIRPDPKSPDSARLHVIAVELEAVIAAHAPQAAAIEEIFVARSAAAALKLGMARGVAMAQCAAAGLPLRELAARQVKKSVVGTGAADKTQVAAMVTRLLGVTAVNADAADALAIAIAAGHDGMAGFGKASGAADATAGGSSLEKAIAAALARDAGNGRGEG
ncbi:MAG: crossover junction endodeoxyribonuclease RuvC [Pseudomonadota bacterium]|nr:crossover junction endodeoxyribonuclease RuvC [Pseudomonadota bacterium]MEC8269704.1 crossover junction endodeoxyribonuclease RuvC [Pseudomonadota bacterium]MEC8712459.1 crossover junction endodeoxyribonuclease RuvC [Pseudomonadota bacterium]